LVSTLITLKTYPLLLKTLLIVLPLFFGKWAYTQDILSLLPYIEGDEITYDLKTGETVVTGSPSLSYDGWLLLGDEIRYNQKTGEATARGNISLTRDAFRLIGDSITYSTDENSAEVTNFRAGQYPAYLQGDTISGNIEQAQVKNAVAYVGQPNSLAPRASALEVRYFKDDKVEADKLVVKLGGLSVFYNSAFRRGLEGGKQSFEAWTGYRKELGGYLHAGVRVPISETVEAGGFIDLFSKRGVMAGPSVKYRSQGVDKETFGKFEFGYLKDQGDPGQDILRQNIDSERYFLDWKHKQQVNENVTFTGMVNYWSDSDVTRDFRHKIFRNAQGPDTFLEGVYRGDNYLISAFTRFRPNDFQIVQERLPEVRFDLLPTHLGSGILTEFQASVAALREESFVANQSPLRSDRLDFYTNLSRSFRPTEWLTFTPIAGGRWTYYDRALNGRDNYSRLLGELGFDAEMKIFAVYDYQNPVWEIEGIRHLVEPMVQYRYIPEADKGSAYIPPIDDFAFSTQLQPLGLGEVRNIDDLSETHALRIGLDNIFQTRNAEYGSRDLLRFFVAGDLYFSNLPGTDDFSAIHTQVDFTPAEWLRLSLFSRVDSQSFDLRELNTQVTITDQEFWEIGLGTSALKGEIEQYQLYARYRLNEAFELYARIQYDARQDRFNEQSYGVSHILRNQWRINYGISSYSDARRESGTRIDLEIEFLSF
jgi:LPS-assembly protein